MWDCIRRNNLTPSGGTPGYIYGQLRMEELFYWTITNERPYRSGTWYILCKITDANGCISNKTRTIIRSTPPVAAPTAINQTVCSNGTTTQALTATATGGTITWYDAAAENNSVTTQIGVRTKTYYALLMVLVLVQLELP
jgi:hypothetical protein